MDYSDGENKNVEIFAMGFAWGSSPVSNISPSHCHGFSDRET